MSITTDFHAAKEISSDLVAVLLSNAVDISPVMDVLYINLMSGEEEAGERDYLSRSYQICVSSLSILSSSSSLENWTIEILI